MAKKKETAYEPIACKVKIGEEEFSLEIVKAKVNVPGYGILEAAELAKNPEALLVLVANQSFSIQEIK